MISSSDITIRRLSLSDAPFVMQLYNQPSFIRYIADKHISDISAAEQYISGGPMACFAEHGFALDVVSIPDPQLPTVTSLKLSIGVCGLLKRPELAHPDLGFALLDEYSGQGYAFVACQAVIKHALTVLRLENILAIVLPTNTRSITLLKRLGFVYQRDIELYEQTNQLYQYLPNPI
ncbi:MAG: GNAT family N-acetyltransferase [Glaciecola sp.]|nr:GNAT family N-acetyltransferase [Glaciecola sp.]